MKKIDPDIVLRWALILGVTSVIVLLVTSVIVLLGICTHTKFLLTVLYSLGMFVFMLFSTRIRKSQKDEENEDEEALVEVDL